MRLFRVFSSVLMPRNSSTIIEKYSKYLSILVVHHSLLKLRLAHSLHVRGVNGKLALDNCALRLIFVWARVPFANVDALDDDAVRLWKDAQHLALIALFAVDIQVLRRRDVLEQHNCVAFLDMDFCFFSSQFHRSRSVFFFHLSGRRDSNPRPTAWKAVTLPAELLPLIWLIQLLKRTVLTFRLRPTAWKAVTLPALVTPAYLVNSIFEKKQSACGVQCSTA